jgi:hypothetical protein
MQHVLRHPAVRIDGYQYPPTAGPYPGIPDSGQIPVMVCDNGCVIASGDFLRPIGTPVGNNDDFYRLGRLLFGGADRRQAPGNKVLLVVGGYDDRDASQQIDFLIRNWKLDVRCSFKIVSSRYPLFPANRF